MSLQNAHETARRILALSRGLKEDLEARLVSFQQELNNCLDLLTKIEQDINTKNGLSTENIRKISTLQDSLNALKVENTELTNEISEIEKERNKIDDEKEQVIGEKISNKSELAREEEKNHSLKQRLSKTEVDYTNTKKELEELQIKFEEEKKVLEDKLNLVLNKKNLIKRQFDAAEQLIRKKAITTSEIKILKFIGSGRPMTKATLISSLGIAESTIENLINELVDVKALKIDESQQIIPLKDMGVFKEE